MSLTVVRQIDWEKILEGYGSETKEALRTLLREHDVPEDDPAAVVIAAQFISQIETTRAFTGLSDTLEQGKSDIAGELRAHVDQLRGIVYLAQEQLIDTGQEDVEARQQALLDAVKQGVSKAIATSNARAHHRSLVHMLSLISATGALAISCLAGGAMLTASIMRPELEPTLSTVENAETWEAIARQNQDNLKLCQENIIELEGKCRIVLPE